MSLRLLICVCAAASALAQYSGLATNFDGSQVFVATTYRQRGTDQATHPKVFRLENGAVSLVTTQVCRPLQGSPCGIDDLQASGSGSVVYQSWIFCQGLSSCVLSERQSGTLLSGRVPVRYGGRIRISRNGRYVANHDMSGAPGDSIRISRLYDLRTGESVNLGSDLRRMGVVQRVSDDGAVLMSGGWLVRPGVRVEVTTPAGASVTDMDAQGRIVLTETGGALFGADVRAGRSWQIGPSDRASYGGSLSDDGEWILYISVIGETPQVFFSSIDGRIWRQLTADRDGAERVALSGDGRVAVVLTRAGAVLRIDTATAASEQLVGPLPRAITFSGSPVPGSIGVLTGRGLSTERATAVGTWPEELAGVRLTHDGVAMRLQSVSPEQVVFQIPWEVVPSDAPLVFHTGANVFEATIAIGVSAVRPALAVVAHEDFGSLVSEEKPARPGEIVHIYATGLGRVEPIPATGEPTPTQPLSRLANGWMFVWDGLFSRDRSPADVPFAGLAPGIVGVYQVDIRIPDRERYDLWFVGPTGRSGFSFATVPVLK